MAALTPMFVIMILKATQKGHECYQLYHSSSQICCNGTVLAKSEEHTYCCGSQSYTPTSGLMCCNNRLLQAPQGDGIYDCCGQDEIGNILTYDRTRQRCCQGAIFDQPTCGTIWTCCGQAMCEFSSGKCCGGVIKPKKGNEMCCGSKEIDLDTEVCCLFSQYSPGAHEHDFVGYSANKTDPDQDGCCEGVPYNTTNEICCTGQLLPRPSDLDMQCCGYQLFNVRSEICCGYKVFPAYETARCCWSAAQVYDYTLQACCHDLVVPITEPGSKDTACCTEFTY